jgi:hypothetical protein
VDERERLAQQTARNLRGLELERAGRSLEALTLYEQNVADGFEGDWPYGRLVAAYERDGDLAAAERVLERAIEVFSASRRRTPADRRATVRAFKGRLRLVKRAGAARDRASKRKTPRLTAESAEG